MLTALIVFLRAIGLIAAATEPWPLKSGPSAAAGSADAHRQPSALSLQRPTVLDRARPSVARLAQRFDVRPVRHRGALASR